MPSLRMSTMTPAKTTKKKTTTRPPSPARLEALERARAARQRVKPLEDGEAARPVQIRGPVAVVEWAANMTPEQRGAALAYARISGWTPSAEDA